MVGDRPAGRRTRAQVDFQGCAKIAKDGIVGPNTWRELDDHITDTSSDYAC